MSKAGASAGRGGAMACVAGASSLARGCGGVASYGGLGAGTAALARARLNRLTRGTVNELNRSPRRDR